MDLRLSHWISHKYLLLTSSLIDSSWNCLIQIEIVKCCQQEFGFSLPSITLTHRTEFFLGKIRQCENLLVKRLLCMLSYYSLWYYRLSMYLSSHASLLVYLVACAFGLLCFIRCFLVKLYILFNRLISTVLPSWWWIKMYEGRSINKLQNGAILSFFKIWKFQNTRFVGDLILSKQLWVLLRWRHCDIIYNH